MTRSLLLLFALLVQSGTWAQGNYPNRPIRWSGSSAPRIRRKSG